MADLNVRPRSRVAVVAIVAIALTLLVALAALMSGLGTRWGLWNFRTGFQILRYSAMAAIATAVLALVAALLTRPGVPRRGFVLSVVALVVSLVVVGIPYRFMSTAKGVPPIHDITTDVNNPPRFVAVLPLRKDAANPAEYGGPEIARQQQQAYPDIQPLLLQLPEQRAFQRALDAAKSMGWEIVATDPAAGRIEATARTFWFGFRDDVVVRLTPVGDRTVLDVRSVSRVGKGDVGTNAKRVREYLNKVKGE
jgi:uncharacterized protein (DUF1499 family)